MNLERVKLWLPRFVTPFCLCMAAWFVSAGADHWGWLLFTAWVFTW